MTKVMRVLRWGLWSVVAMSLLATIGWTGLNWMGTRRLANVMETLRKANHPLTVEQLAPPGVRSEENAAPLYHAALAVISHPENPRRFDLMSLARKGLDPLSGEEKAALRSLLGENAEALSLAERGAARPKSRWADSYYSVSYASGPKDSNMYYLIVYVACRAHFEILDGRPEAARKSVAILLAIARALRREPLWLLQAYCAFAVELAVAVADKAVARDTPVEELGKWQLLLPQSEEFRGRGAFAARCLLVEMADFMALSPDRMWGAMRERNPRRPQRVPLWMLHPLIKREGARRLELLARGIGACQRPDWEAEGALAEIERESPPVPKWLWGLPNFAGRLKREFDRSKEIEARIAVARAGLWCEAVRAGTGKYPDRLGLIDPITGRDLTYEPDDGLIWSGGSRPRKDAFKDEIAWRLRAK